MPSSSAPLVVIALHGEAAGAFEAAGVPVLYCGVGKVNAAIALTRELARCALDGRPMPLVLNFGSAGSRNHPPGSLVSCHEFVQRDMDVSGLGFERGTTPFDPAPATLSFEPVFRDLPAAVCASGDSFATGAMEVASGVVDMEGYALAKACWVHGASFACAKFVSDGADHGAAQDWKRNMHKAAQRFLSLYLSVVRQSADPG
ncbi:MAG TPA: 5'-nucleosidase [Steroidobacteraceae bacterium]|nr:5'-nucleosidase [Steroidobacteraceae bacterium]